MARDHIAGLIAVAGLSSRMKDFKPLLPLDGKALIKATADTLRPWVKDLYVVAGNRLTDVQAALQSMDARFIRNERFADTSMFESVRLGVAALAPHSGGFFFLPGDVPLVAEHTIRALLKIRQTSGARVIQPVYRGSPGHPPFVDASCYDEIIRYDGQNGLRGALDCFQKETLLLEVPDPAILMDADRPEDYHRLLQYVKDRNIPAPGLCEDILRWFQVPDHVSAHCARVAEVAVELAQRLARAGHPLNIPLIQAGALLHDVAKGAGHRQHDIIGGEWLTDLGYPAIAVIVTAHTDLPDEAMDLFDERAVVHLADKLVQRQSDVTVEQRFQTVIDRFTDTPEALAAALRRKQTAQRLQQRFLDIIKERETYD
jgi:CTP:molybdopterin cytidylyltransferase MocA/HD superfamily phosphohydrolase YqeK